MENLDLDKRWPEKLVEEMLVTPDSLKLAESKLLAVTLKLEDLQKQLDYWELFTARLIAEEVNSEGKKIYSNESVREAELLKRKTESKEYNFIKEEYDKKRFEKEELKIEVVYLDRRFKALRQIAELIAAR